jgi:hypothetical protein
MQFIVHTQADLDFLQGKFVLQVNNNEPDRTLMNFDWGFVKEKRLYLVSRTGFIDLYGNRCDSSDLEMFKLRYTITRHRPLDARSN